MTDLNVLVNAAAEQVVAKVKPDLSRLQQTPQIQPVLLNVKEVAIHLGRTEQSVQQPQFSKGVAGCAPQEARAS